MKRFKKILCLILILCMILTEISLSNINLVEAIPDVQYQGQYGADGYLYATEKTVLPNGVEWRNKKMYHLI